MAVAVALSSLAGVVDEDPCWFPVAAPTTWTAQGIAEYLGDALLFSAGPVAGRVGRRLPLLSGAGLRTDLFRWRESSHGCCWTSWRPRGHCWQ